MCELRSDVDQHRAFEFDSEVTKHSLPGNNYERPLIPSELCISNSLFQSKKCQIRTSKPQQ